MQTFTRHDIAAMLASEYLIPGNEQIVDRIIQKIAAYSNSRLVNLFNRRNQGMNLVTYGSNRFHIEYDLK